MTSKVAEASLATTYKMLSLTPDTSHPFYFVPKMLIMLK